jgi:hypothetical protein
MNAVVKHDEPSTAVTDYAGGILAVIERAVRDPSVDIDKMERLLAMQERVMSETAKREFNTAFRAAKSEMKAVVRNKFNDQTKSGYADLDAVSAAIDPVIDRHGFALTFGTGSADLPNHYRVTCDVLHEGGHERSYYADVPVDMVGIKGNQNKTATHGFGSTMSYGRRYLKLMIYDLATRDDDGNGATTFETISAAQAKEMRDLLTAKGKSEARFVAFAASNCRYPVERIEDIRTADFAPALKVLRES